MSRFVALGQLIPIFPDLMFEFVIFFAIRHNNKIKRLAATICVYAQLTEIGKEDLYQTMWLKLSLIHI